MDGRGRFRFEFVPVLQRTDTFNRSPRPDFIKRQTEPTQPSPLTTARHTPNPTMTGTVELQSLGLPQSKAQMTVQKKKNRGNPHRKPGGQFAERGGKPPVLASFKRTFKQKPRKSRAKGSSTNNSVCLLLCNSKTVSIQSTNCWHESFQSK